MRRMINKKGQLWVKSLEDYVAQNGDTTEVGGNLYVDGDAELFENIVDSNGHKRFVEGNITTTEVTGVTCSYAKWSLSGSHLTLVIAGIIAEDTTISSTLGFGVISLDTWILNKIYPAISTYVGDYTGQLIDYNSYVATTFRCGVDKITSGLRVDLRSITSSSYPRAFRIQIDLLIDNA